jgi:predicted Zn-dependent protease
MQKQIKNAFFIMKLFKVKLKIYEQPAYRQTGILILLDFSYFSFVA